MSNYNDYDDSNAQRMDFEGGGENTGENDFHPQPTEDGDTNNADFNPQSDNAEAGGEEDNQGEEHFNPQPADDEDTDNADFNAQSGNAEATGEEDNQGDNDFIPPPTNDGERPYDAADLNTQSGNGDAGGEQDNGVDHSDAVENWSQNDSDFNAAADDAGVEYNGQVDDTQGQDTTGEEYDAPAPAPEEPNDAPGDYYEDDSSTVINVTNIVMEAPDDSGEDDTYERSLLQQQQEAYERERDAFQREQDAYEMERDAYERERDADQREMEGDERARALAEREQALKAAQQKLAAAQQQFAKRSTVKATPGAGAAHRPQQARSTAKASPAKATPSSRPASGEKNSADLLVDVGLRLFDGVMGKLSAPSPTSAPTATPKAATKAASAQTPKKATPAAQPPKKM